VKRDVLLTPNWENQSFFLIKHLPGDVDNKVVPLQRSQPVLSASFGAAFDRVLIETLFGQARLAATGLLLDAPGYGYPPVAQQKISFAFLRATTGPWLAYRRLSQTSIRYSWPLAKITLADACSNFEKIIT